MNLSDLVHRTAGDSNKVLNNSNNSTRQLLPQQPSNLFQQVAATHNTDSTTNGAATANANNVFANLNRQDQSAFLFSMPNMSQTDWINSNLFFNGATDNFIDPTIPNGNALSPNASNSFLNQDLSFLNPSPPPQQQQQRTYQPPTIAPYPSAQHQQQQQNMLTQNNRFNQNANTAMSIIAPVTPANVSAVTTFADVTMNKSLGSASKTTLINHQSSSPVTSNAMTTLNFSSKVSPNTSAMNSSTTVNAITPNNNNRINFNYTSPPNNTLTLNRTPPTSTLNFSSNSNSPTNTKPLQFNFDNSPSPSAILNTQPSFIKANSASPAANSALQFNSNNSTTNSSTTSIKTPPSIPLLLKKAATPPSTTTASTTKNKLSTIASPSSTNIHNHSITSATPKQPTDQTSFIKSPIKDSSLASVQPSIEKLFVEKKKEKVKLTVTGDNVNANNIEDGYIQFVLNHDPHYIGDSIESLIHAKRKFSSVPKTGDISYTTWDIYQLVLKLHEREIKNWSQLVGQLGLADMAGRPQFAQRVKRWMHRNKIDCYFDYLLGNEYDFHTANENYAGCLMMGNHKKKKLDHEEPSAAANHHGGTESEEDNHDVAENKIPILLAGSRKRMRDHSQNSQQLIENARQFLRKQNDSSSEDEEDEDEEEVDEMVLDDDEEPRVKKEIIESSDSDEDDEVIRLNINGTVQQPTSDSDDQMETADEEEEEEIDEDEEDELASTSSSPGSPAAINSSPKLVATISTIAKPSPKISAPLPPLTTTLSTTQTTLSNSAESSTSCSSHEATISEMKKEINRLNAYIKTLEATVDLQSSMTSQMNKLLRLRDRTERWRKQLIEDLAKGPPQLSDEDDLDETEDDDDRATQSTVDV